VGGEGEGKKKRFTTRARPVRKQGLFGNRACSETGPVRKQENTKEKIGKEKKGKEKA